jgi:hypothetical protein
MKGGDFTEAEGRVGKDTLQIGETIKKRMVVMC